MAERLAIPGFRSAQRWVTHCAPGDGKYLATYELDSPAVLTSREYLQRFENQTPWSKRCLGKAVVFKRWACEQVQPGTADPHPEAKAVVMALDGRPLSLPGILQIRKFRAVSGENITLYELAAPSSSSAYRLYQP
jgi:hypothetical protein